MLTLRRGQQKREGKQQRGSTSVLVNKWKKALKLYGVMRNVLKKRIQ